MSFDLAPYIQQFYDHQPLNYGDSKTIFLAMAEGQCEPQQMGAFLTAQYEHGISADELHGAVDAMREKMIAFEVPEALKTTIMDCCGTGGTGLHTLNISTAVAFVLAGAGVPVVKHGNKAITSKSGSADVLQALGININVAPSVMKHSLEQNNIAFLMAPLYHPAMKHVAPVRKALGVKTIFNLMGPLLNPATPQYQMIGVFDSGWCQPFAEMLLATNMIAAAIVHGDDGQDEISLTGPTQGILLESNALQEININPPDYGYHAIADIQLLAGGSPDHNAAQMRRMLGGEAGAYRDAVLLNAEFALRLHGHKNPKQAAMESIDSGAALKALNGLCQLTKGTE